MIEKRRRAQRSRLLGSVGVFKRVSRCAVPTATLMEVEITNPRGDWLSTTSACDYHPSFSMTGCPTVKGERKIRSRINDSAAVPIKRSIRPAGSWLKATGGMKRAQVACQSGVSGNCSTHQFRQRWIVRAGTLNVSPSCATADVAAARPADINTTANPKYTRRPRNRTDTDVVRFRQRLQQKLKRDS